MSLMTQDRDAAIFFQMLKRGGPACVHGLIQAFRSQGLGEVVDSWTGTEEKRPVTAAQVEQVLGKQQIAVFAAMLRIAPELLPGQLAQWLPDAIHDFSPR